MCIWQKWIFSAFLLAIVLLGCTSEHYYRRHNLRHLNIVFTDIETINRLYRQRSRQGDELDYYVDGFFDPNTNTIYVEKMDFETLGHEVTHAVFAPDNFHPTTH